MEKYKESKKKYNSDKTFVQISKQLHSKMKQYCLEKNIKVKDFLDQLINEGLK